MKKLLNRIGKSISKKNKERAYEVSYQTGIGWKYEKGDEHKDWISRKIQRYAPNVSSNNRFVRLSISGDTSLTDFVKRLDEVHRGEDDFTKRLREEDGEGYRKS